MLLDKHEPVGSRSSQGYRATFVVMVDVDGGLLEFSENCRPWMERLEHQVWPLRFEVLFRRTMRSVRMHQVQGTRWPNGVGGSVTFRIITGRRI